VGKSDHTTTAACAVSWVAASGLAGAEIDSTVSRQNRRCGQ